MNEELDWADLVRAQHGVVSTAQAHARGVSPRTVGGRVRSGVWLWRHAGVIATTVAPLSRYGEQVAALLSLGDDAVLSHYDAAALWRCEVDLPREVHVTVPRSVRRSPRQGVVLHRTRTLEARDAARRSGLPVTSLERTVVDLLEVMPHPADRKALLAGVFQRRITTEARLLGVLARLPKLHRRQETLRLLGFAHRGSHSGPEIDVYEWMLAAGFPVPQRQFPITIHGIRRWLDLCLAELRINIETDGMQHLTDLNQRAADHRRDAWLVAHGWVVFRITLARLRREPDVVARELWLVIERQRRLVELGLLAPAVPA